MAFFTEKSILQFWSKNPQFGLQGVEGVCELFFEFEEFNMC